MLVLVECQVLEIDCGLILNILVLLSFIRVLCFCTNRAVWIVPSYDCVVFCSIKSVQICRCPVNAAFIFPIACHVKIVKFQRHLYGRIAPTLEVRNNETTSFPYFVVTG